MRIALSLLALASLIATAGCRDDDVGQLTGGVQGLICNPLTGRTTPGADVTATFRRDGSDKDETKTATTDENGFFSLKGLPTVQVKITAIKADEFRIDVPLLVDIEPLKNVDLGNPACSDVPPQPGKGSIGGRICNRHTGDIVTDGVVTVVMADGSTVTADTDPVTGDFVLPDIPAGSYVVYIQASGFQKSYLVEVTEGETVLVEQAVGCEPPDPLTTGKIVGTICSDDLADPDGGLGGVRVFTEITTGGETVTFEDETLEDGSFTLAGIPAPSTGVVVHAEKGGFQFTFDPVDVFPIAQNQEGTRLTLEDECQPLAPDDGRRYLVVNGIFDRIGQVLDRMGLNNVDFAEGSPADGHLWAPEVFGNYDQLSQYDAVFVNCGILENDLVQPGGLNAGVKANIKRYIQEGGSLYVSDWAYDLIEQVYPDKINFLGDDTTNSSAEYGIDGVYDAAVVDPGLRQYVGADTIDIDFGFGNFAIVSAVAPGVTTYLKTDMQYAVNGGAEVLPDTPVTVGFSDGFGRVIFTSFHQETDPADGTTEILDGPEDAVLRYLVFSL